MNADEDTGVRDALRAAFDEGAATSPDPAPAAVDPPTQATDTAAATDTSQPAEKSDQPRDEHGRFASAKPESTEPAGSKPADAKASEPAPAEPAVDPQTATREQNGQPPVAPPRHWSDKGKVAWQRLPRAVQEELVKVDAQGQYGQLHDVVEPHRARFAMLGQTPQQAIGGLLTVWEALQGDPSGTLQWLAQQYGVNLGKPAAAQAATAPGQAHEQAEPEYVDPAIKQLRDAFEARFKAQEERYQTLQNQWQSSQQLAETQRRTSLSAEVQAFRSDPAHPHYDIVEETMASLIKAGRATGLTDAYDQAVWLHPELREELIAGRMQADQQRREAESRQRAEAARKAAGSVTGSPTPGATVTDMPPMDLRSQIASAMANGRA